MFDILLYSKSNTHLPYKKNKNKNQHPKETIQNTEKINRNSNSFSVFLFPPPLLRHNWQVKLRIFKVYNMMIYMYALWNGYHNQIK